MDKQRTNGRAGFTAIEILIVVAIIALLMSIAAGALIRVKAASERTATETTLTKLASILDRHWKAVIDAAKKEYDGLPTPIKQNLITLADNQANTPTTPKPHPRRDDRARLLYVKYRLKQEFPASFDEAIDPDPTCGGFLPPTGPAPAIPNRPTSIPGVRPANSTGKPAYVKFVSDFYAQANSPVAQGVSWLNMTLYPSPRYQSAILLVLALEQDRQGVPRANLDQEIGTTFIASGRQDSGSPAPPLSNPIQLARHLVDSWGNPLQLFIFPSYPIGHNASTTDLDVAFTITANPRLTNNQALREKLQSGGGPDPLDPEGLLLDSSISAWAPPAFPTLRPGVLVLPHLQFAPPPPVANGTQLTFTLRKMTPTIVSAGPDGLIGKKSPSATFDNGCAAINPQMEFLNSTDCFDNIYSFRLRQTAAKGD
jgi:prepilin-type N-terminal cleavage/methylation domain-containing protein